MKVFVIQSLLALAQGAQQLGRLVNILAQKDDLISKFEDVGTRSGLLLMKENKDCIQKQDNSDATGTNEVKEGLEEVSDMISGGLGMTGGYGPVKASIKSTWSFTDTEKKKILCTLYSWTQARHGKRYFKKMLE